ncbi:virulence factor Mce family protein [Striga asiatica]|uniref:Virulence factor Mce family protein n=1 Tax=Striga asiatica TaxID=4170 RepID=A0A5A7P2G3_STRAF|nr:virulence factor Mce family protein [Striga asiatica]
MRDKNKQLMKRNYDHKQELVKVSHREEEMKSAEVYSNLGSTIFLVFLAGGTFFMAYREQVIKDFCRSSSFLLRFVPAASQFFKFALDEATEDKLSDYPNEGKPGLLVEHVCLSPKFPRRNRNLEVRINATEPSTKKTVHEQEVATGTSDAVKKTPLSPAISS